MTCLTLFLINYSKTQKQNRITKMSVAEGKHVLLIHFFVVFWKTKEAIILPKNNTSFSLVMFVVAKMV